MRLPSKQDLLTDLQDYVMWFQKNWRMVAKRAAKYALIALPFLIIIWQFTYSNDKLPLFMKIDNMAVGGLQKEKAIRDLNRAYREKTLNLYIESAEEPFATPKLPDAGIITDNTKRVEAVNYPWYLRLVPTSAFWVTFVLDEVQPVEYKSDKVMSREFVKRELGENCRIEPVNPSVEKQEDKIIAMQGRDGGICEIDDVVSELADARPVLVNEAEIRLDVETIEPAIKFEELEKLVSEIEKNLKDGVTVAVADEKINLEEKQVRDWLEFQTDGDAIIVNMKSDKAGQTLTEKMGDKLARPAGVTKITTRDFTEIGRQEGAKGQELDIAGTLGSMLNFLKGEAEMAQATTKEVPPRIEYTRTYTASHAGLSALIKNYAQDKPGDYGVSLVELSGARRSAGVNENKQFVTASTYKTYVAYSVLRRIESGEFKWNNPIIGGRNLAQCFDAMIVNSDNPCAEELVKKIGYTPLHNDVRGLGLNGTSFIDMQSFKTTAGDLSRFMAMLEVGQLPISEENREKFIKVLKRNVHRQGIPSGTTGEVANKVGFLDKYLHDTAIVYSPKGTYVLTIMTSDSSWANIADLTRQIEGLR